MGKADVEEGHRQAMRRELLCGAVAQQSGDAVVKRAFRLRL
jgi:hypothetical protein